MYRLPTGIKKGWLLFQSSEKKKEVLPLRSAVSKSSMFCSWSTKFSLFKHKSMISSQKCSFFMFHLDDASVPRRHDTFPVVEARHFGDGFCCQKITHVSEFVWFGLEVFQRFQPLVEKGKCLVKKRVSLHESSSLVRVSFYLLYFPSIDIF